MGGIIFKAIIGMLAGIVSWALVEPFKPSFTDVQAWQAFETKMMLAWAIALGASVGAATGYQRGSKTHMWRECALGALFAAIGVMAGRGISAPFAAMINIPMTQVIGRTLAIGAIGAGMGAGLGFNTFVWRRCLQGMVGGLLGGLIAGALFDLVGTLTSSPQLSIQGVQAGATGEVGSVSRAVTAALMCGAIALMIGIVEALSKSAWLRLELGRNEGKEWVLDKPVNNIGRDERADVPLFGDMNVLPLHARIVKNASGFFLEDMGSQVGVGINGQRAPQSINLSSGDVVQIAGFNLRFMIRNQKAPARPADAGRGYYPIQSPVAPTPGLQQPMAPMQPMQQPFVPQGAPLQQTQVISPMPQTHAMAPTGILSLVALDGPLAGQRFPVDRPIEIGRESAQIPISFDTAASRRHAEVSASGLEIMVRDLGSTNGTYINGIRTTLGTAKMGDILKVGGTSFRIES